MKAKDKIEISTRVSVLMPAHNAEQYVIAAISSILSQEYTNFKLIILNDGSTDGTGKILSKFKDLDSRIEIHENPQKTGILAARDKLLSLVDTEFYAWMDADDISTPDRLRKQITFLESNPKIDVVGGAWSILGTNKVTVPYSEPKEIKAAMLVSNPFHNPVMMVRTEISRSLNFTYLNCGVKSASDFAFVTELNKVGTFSTLPDVLYFYRIHPSQESTANGIVQRASLKSLMRRQFEYHGIEVPDSIVSVIRTFPGELTTKKQVNAVALIYKRLLEANSKQHWYDQDYLTKHLTISFRRMCSTHGFLGICFFIRHFGIIQLFKGKQYGIAFIKDCLKRPRQTIDTDI
ncbi:glycosyltransferase family 2 protein [Alteromonas macleodii]|uniref:glycosyltransferase family 2 protein n=1 Tax=Alteromonas macleodii TaxID=28108 RepID=UPI003BF80CA6